jgi:two-component system, chemotaxis family, protein-glutamate methylesterase/glutaminase
MQGHDVVVIGASAGGIEVLLELARGLPSDLAAAVCVVVHIPEGARGALPTLLDRAGPLPAAFARDGDKLQSGRFHVAPPGHHLLIADGVAHLTRGPRENGHRPSVDVLFRSAAAAHDGRVVGVILSGTRDDGAAGLSDVKERGGLALVQDPDDAMYGAMPRNAISRCPVDEVVASAGLASAVCAMVARPAAPGNTPPSGRLNRELAIAGAVMDALHGPPEILGEPSGFSCPDCHGVLYDVGAPEHPRYRCRVGHAWSSASLYGEQSTALEEALWVALRALEEKAALARRLADDARRRGRRLTAEQFEDRSRMVQQQAASVREVIVNHDPATEGI